MSLFFRQILILRHYVNYIEEKQDKSSIFLSSSVQTQAGVDIKILSGHSSSNVLLPRGIGIHSQAIGGQRRRANKDEDRGDGHYAEHPIHTTDEDNNVVPNLSRGTQSILARRKSGGASIGGSALPQAVIIILWWRQRFHRRKWRFHSRTAFTIGGKWGRRSSSSSFKASNGEIRSKVKACLPVIENHSP